MNCDLPLLIHRLYRVFVDQIHQHQVNEIDGKKLNILCN
jgi:hypothetical protein